MPNPVVPAIPPLSAIADPNTRAVLQALINGWQVRNGQVGSGDNAFLTALDIPQVVNQYFTSSSNTSSGGGVTGPMAPVIDAIIREVVNSREWLALQEKIVRIETPDWLRDAMRLAQTDIARQVTTLAARLGENEAGFGEERIARVTLERSVVEAFKQMVASYGESTAAITDISSAIATYANAEANRVSQLYVENGTYSAGIQQQQQVNANINGVTSAMYTLRVQAGNVVTGMSFGASTNSAGQATSNIVFSAASFAVGNASTNVVPFTVKTAPWVDSQGVTHSAGVYITNAKIAQATIDNLTVTTSLIQPGAVGRIGYGYAWVDFVPDANPGWPETPLTTAPFTCVTVAISAPGATPSYPASYLVNSTIFLTPDPGSLAASAVKSQVYLNDVAVGFEGYGYMAAEPTTLTTSCVVSLTSAGTHTLKLKCWLDTSGGGVSSKECWGHAVVAAIGHQR